MPYKVVGNRVMHKKGGKWTTKAQAKSPAAAERQRRLLEGIEHGWHPTGKGARKRVPTK